MSATCPICNSLLISLDSHPGGRHVTSYECPRCGKFMLSGSLVATLPHLHSTYPDAAAKLSHAIQRAQERAEPVVLNTNTAKAVLEHALPRPREQADLLIRWLAKNVPGPGETIWVEFSTHGSIIGSKSPAGFEMVLDHLFANALVIGNQSKPLQGGDGAFATLSFEGWEYYEQLRQGGAVYRKAFMAMKFGDEQLNLVLKSVFKPYASMGSLTPRQPPD